MTLDCSNNQNYPQGHEGLPLTEHVKINVPPVSCLTLGRRRLLFLGPLSDKNKLAGVPPWFHIQGSQVTGLQALTGGDSLCKVVAMT